MIPEERYAGLSNEELVVLVKSGDMEAAGRLYEQNMGLIRRYCRMTCADPCEFEDFLQESFFYILRAAKKFDPSLGFKFSTYMCIRVQRGLERYAYEKGCDPDLISADAHIRPDSDDTLITFQADPSAEFEEDTLEKINRDELRDAIEEIIDELEPRQALSVREILSGETLERCALSRGLSRERVRQLHQKVIRTLRKPEYADRLLPYIDDSEYERLAFKGTGFRRFRETGYSSVEMAVEKILSKKEALRYELERELADDY
jgi:RNA polymerase sigma factor (sigma-70 family)